MTSDVVAIVSVVSSALVGVAGVTATFVQIKSIARERRRDREFQLTMQERAHAHEMKALSQKVSDDAYLEYRKQEEAHRHSSGLLHG